MRSHVETSEEEFVLNVKSRENKLLRLFGLFGGFDL